MTISGNHPILLLPLGIRRNLDERNKMIKQDLAGHNSWILGGSVINWGPEWKDISDLVIFLYIPNAISIQRLREREFEHYGNSTFTNDAKALKYEVFTKWTYGYDNTTNGRNLKAHESWLQQLTVLSK